MTRSLEFLKAGLKNPLQIATLFETSDRVAKRFANHLNIQSDEIAIELGVGAGGITDILLQKLERRDQYVGFELNRDLFTFLRHNYPDLEIHNASATTLNQYTAGRKVGAVISTLPWSIFNKDQRDLILNQIEQVLSPGGTFSTFVAYHVRQTEAAQDFIAGLELRFNDIQIESEILNFPPCYIYSGKKFGPTSNR